MYHELACGLLPGSLPGNLAKLPAGGKKGSGYRFLSHGIRIAGHPRMPSEPESAGLEQGVWT